MKSPWPGSVLVAVVRPVSRADLPGRLKRGRSLRLTRPTRPAFLAAGTTATEWARAATPVRGARRPASVLRRPWEARCPQPSLAINRTVGVNVPVIAGAMTPTYRRLVRPGAVFSPKSHIRPDDSGAGPSFRQIPYKAGPSPGAAARLVTPVAGVTRALRPACPATSRPAQASHSPRGSLRTCGHHAPEGAIGCAGTRPMTPLGVLPGRGRTRRPPTSRTRPLGLFPPSHPWTKSNYY
jgi:hypothetical protein